jgi:hypothetical protein
VFNYINEVRLWTDGTCAWKTKYFNFPDHIHIHHQNHPTTITNNFPYCKAWKYYCRTTVACIPTEYIILDRCFSGQTIGKNGEIIEHYLINLLVGSYSILLETNQSKKTYFQILLIITLTY